MQEREGGRGALVLLWYTAPASAAASCARSKPVMTVADGVWLDGDGPDNGAKGGEGR